MGERDRASTRWMFSSPGIPKTYSTPSLSRHSTMSSATVIACSDTASTLGVPHGCDLLLDDGWIVRRVAPVRRDVVGVWRDPVMCPGARAPRDAERGAHNRSGRPGSGRMHIEHGNRRSRDDGRTGRPLNPLLPGSMLGRPLLLLPPRPGVSTRTGPGSDREVLTGPHPGLGG